MNRDKQIIKNIENKKFQAQEEYAKNKALLSESRIQEKVDYIRPAEQRPENQQEKVEDAKDEVSK
ncbi:MAG: hypothetical protein LUH22_04295 [Bacteroides sp.]|nr:hypothetical protein [Bacteroides sp.]